MVFTDTKTKVGQRFIKRLAATRVMGWVLARVMHRLAGAQDYKQVKGTRDCPGL